MILNQRQYRVTKGQISKLNEALNAARSTKEKMAPRVYDAMIAGIESQIKELQDQLLEYDQLANKSKLNLRSFEDLPQVLIKARIAKGHTQKSLAEKLKMKPQQIQKYEATFYESVSWKRICLILKALDVDLKGYLPLKS